MFQDAKWIWSRAASGADSYSEFYAQADFSGDSRAVIRISADSNYALYLNGRFADSGQYPDLPDHKVYDEIDLTGRIVSGINHIAVIVWYYGVPSFTYRLGTPGLIFEIEQNGKILLSSGENTLSRKSERYLSGKKQMITPQLGLSFHVDLKKDDSWMLGNPAGFEKSIVCSGMPEQLYPREVGKLQIKPPAEGILAGQGVFSYSDADDSSGAKMYHAALSFYGACGKDLSGHEIRMDGGDGIFFFVDLQSECAGYLDFELEVPHDCQMEIGWGEHLEDGRCRTEIDKRDFSVTVCLRRGKNRYMNPFRRFGCRYLQFFVHANEVVIRRAGIRPAEYPLTIRHYHSGNLLRDTIYAVCQNTLKQCMHEHYEDCPWREQSFYALDSRNQMLCGYYAFGETKFPKAALLYMARFLRPDGLLPICFPTDAKLTIPFFSLFYMLQIAEYYRQTGDDDTVKACFPAARTVLDTFLSRMDAAGLVPNFEGADYWNFYEWEPYLDGHSQEGKNCDMCLNAMLSLAIDSFAVFCGAAGADAGPYLQKKARLNQAIARGFFNRESGLFGLCLHAEKPVYSVLANALGFLCGAADGLPRSKMLCLIQKNGARIEGAEVIPASLSMHTFRYEALIRADKDAYKNDILDEIDRVYFNMLRKGATSFWETESGDQAFRFAGSLCHGWSAMPIYYYETLL